MVFKVFVSRSCCLAGFLVVILDKSKKSVDYGVMILHNKKFRRGSRAAKGIRL